MASDGKRNGPALTIAGTCEGCAHLRTSSVVLTCSHPQIRKGLTGFAIVATKASHEAWDMRGNMRHDCPLLPAARLALLVLLASTICRKCGRTVEPERECYAIPTCFACLPPPPPLPVLPSFAAWQKKQEEEADSAAHGAGESEE